MERFDHHKKIKNKNKKIFHCIFKKWFGCGGGGVEKILWRKNILKKPNTPECAQVLVVTCPKPNFVAALLSPPPPVIVVKKNHQKSTNLLVQLILVARMSYTDCVKWDSYTLNVNISWKRHNSCLDSRCKFGGAKMCWRPPWGQLCWQVG